MFVHYLLQASAQGSGIDPAWILAAIGAIGSALSTAVVAVYHGRIADLQARIKRQDEQIDRLLEVGARAVSVQEERQGRSR